MDGQEQTNDKNADGEMRQAQETEMCGEQYVNEENPSVTAELAREITPEQNRFDNMVFVSEADNNLMQSQQQIGWATVLLKGRLIFCLVV